MYLNFNKIVSKGLTPQDLLFLQAVNQQKAEDLEDVVAMYIDDSSLDSFLENGVVEYIKGKKTDSEVSKLRLSKKGRTLLLDLQKKEDWEEMDVTLAEWIESVYAKRPNYVKSNMAELKRRLYWFRFETGIHGNELAILIESFIKDCYVPDPNDDRPFNTQFNEFKKDNPRAQMSNKAENIIWNPKDRFQRHYILENSPLWSYYQQFEEYIEKLWKKKLEK